MSAVLDIFGRGLGAVCIRSFLPTAHSTGPLLLQDWLVPFVEGVYMPHPAQKPIIVASPPLFIIVTPS